MALVNLSPLFPAKVEVRFPGRKCDGDVTQTVPNYYVKSVNLSDVIGSLAANIDLTATGTTGTVKHYNETACASFTPTGGSTPSNQTALDNLAKQVAIDFYNYRSTLFDRMFNGVVSLTPCALYDAIIIDYTVDDYDDYEGDEDDEFDDVPPLEDSVFNPRSIVATRVISARPSGEPEELMHSDPAETSCADGSGSTHLADRVPCIEYYGPPGACSGGISVTRWRLCLVDGRLQRQFVATESL